MSQLTQLDLYQIDAFTDRVFQGNPAAVVPLKSWLPDETMRLIATENNLPETAFFVPKGNGFGLRWFTPTVEINLCGHATLATAFAIKEFLEPGRTQPMVFSTLSGDLHVRPDGEWLVMDFPSWPPQPVDAATDKKVRDAIGVPAEEILFAGGHFMAILSDADVIRDFTPNLAKIEALGEKGVFLTAAGKDGKSDFVSRFFAPQIGIPEDPVTGAIHCLMTPYWSKRLGKQEMIARQISPRGGLLRCALRGDRVEIAGKAVSFLKGQIFIPAV